MAEEQRSLALGVQSVLWRAFGSIPGPLVFGAIFDSSCVYWQYDCGGRRGNCWVYNNSQISLRAFFITFAGVSVNAVMMLLCWIFYPPTLNCFRRSTAKEKEQPPKENGNIHANPVFDMEPPTEKPPADLY